MKHSISRAAALMTAVLLLCLCAVSASLAEAPTATATEAPEAKTTMSPEALQSQGILTVGAKGDAVTRLQQRLKDLGYLNGKVDGQYGGGTKRAVISFQRRNGLDTDGVAGAETQAKLYAEEAIPAPDGT